MHVGYGAAPPGLLLLLLLLLLISFNCCFFFNCFFQGAGAPGPYGTPQAQHNPYGAAGAPPGSVSLPPKFFLV